MIPISDGDLINPRYVVRALPVTVGELSRVKLILSDGGCHHTEWTLDQVRAAVDEANGV